LSRLKMRDTRFFISCLFAMYQNWGVTQTSFTPICQQNTNLFHWIEELISFFIFMRHLKSGRELTFFGLVSILFSPYLLINILLPYPEAYGNPFPPVNELPKGPSILLIHLQGRQTVILPVKNK
jgi:hypothetical protein